MKNPQILKRFSRSQIAQIAESVNVYFNLVTKARIYDLILQVDSIDTALHLLFCHRESTQTLDTIVYDYLHHKDNQ